LRVPLSWLTDFTPIDVDVFDASAVTALGEVLDGLGLVVEGIDTIGGALPGIVLARVVEINAIPGADRVRQVFVDDGSDPRLEIVCGATNFALGDVVALATIGTKLPGGMVIAERKMRGATSHGMLCSSRELELDEDAAGLMIVASPGALSTPLPEGVELGRGLDDFLGLVPEIVFDIAVEPNRPDCLSVLGIARDLAAKLGLPFSYPTPDVEYDEVDATALASVAIADGAGCSALVGRVLRGVTEFASPEFVRRRLELAGMRPISAVVDASNYVMLEFGQPTHAYDLDKLDGRAIRVRMARPGEVLTTLDGEERILGQERLADGDVVDVEDMVITDGADKVVGLAGVMGGADTEITSATTNVMLESACFDSIMVGRTSARLGLRSEASARFWRGVDPAGQERAADRFCELVQIAAKEAGAPVPVGTRGAVRAERVPYTPLRLSLRVERVNALLGTVLTSSEVASLLGAIGFQISGTGEVFDVVVPSWRVDVSREVNLIEEVARHFGYDRIGKRERRSPRVGAFTPYQSRRRKLRSALLGAGINEAWTSSIVDPEIEARTGAVGPFIELTNPIVQGETVLRSGLMGGLLQAIVHNESHRNADIRLFEVGKVFGGLDNDGRPFEQEQLAVALGSGVDARGAMALFSVLVEALGIDADEFVFEQGEFRPVEGEPLATGMHPTRSALVMPRRADPRSRPVVAVIGEVDKAVLSANDIAEARVGWIVADLVGLFSLPIRTQIAKPVSKYPSSDVDLAFILDEEVAAERLKEHLERGAGELLQSIQLIDVYRGDTVTPGTRSLTFRLRLGALDHTLTDAEVGVARASAIDLAEKRLPARLRS
jgi:phenylalanyl-tRNA synthetase beta chain